MILLCLGWGLKIGFDKKNEYKMLKFAKHDYTYRKYC